LTLLGSPKTVPRKLEQGKAWIGYDIFCGNFGIGRMPEPMARESIRLFGKEVVPAFRE
jgi:hypothetical protein